MEIRKELAALVENVLAGTISASTVVEYIETLPRAGDDELVQSTFHALIHCREDEDTPAEDAAYADLQRRWLASFVERLRR